MVIPFRNEAQNLPGLLQSISQWQYTKSKFEVILVNDNSTDEWQNLLSLFCSNNPTINLKVISNQRVSNSPKKDAIKTAIDQAQFDWILTTDADCILPLKWLENYNEYIQSNTVNLISGPVRFISKPTILNVFQELDFLSLQGATMGGFGIKHPFLCNGANMGYRKSWFKEVNGFSGNQNIASGDDIFMLQKAVKTSSAIYLKSNSAIVKTQAENSVNSIIHQRVRWASKTSKYNDWFSKFVGITVYFMNVAILVALLLSIIEKNSYSLFFPMLLLKWNIDIYLLHKTVTFFNIKPILKHYLWCSLLYPVFVTSIASISFFKTYKWKGRTFKT